MEAPLEETCFQAEPESASCVQNFDDSLNSAIRITYRISLRSSSLREPRYPSAGVVCLLVFSSSDRTSRQGDEPLKHNTPSDPARERRDSREGSGQTERDLTRREPKPHDTTGPHRTHSSGSGGAPRCSEPDARPQSSRRGQDQGGAATQRPRLRGTRSKPCAPARRRHANSHPATVRTRAWWKDR